jgi:hypothetical protein
MTRNAIDNGSPQAWLVMQLIDALLDNNFDRLDSLVGQVGDDYGIVFWNLIVVVGGTIQAIANYAGQSFEDVLPGLLSQMAERTDSMDAADVARQALTAWSSGDNELVASLGFDAEIQRVGPVAVLLHLLAMLGVISRSWAKQAGFSMEEIRAGWGTVLGTPD